MGKRRRALKFRGGIFKEKLVEIATLLGVVGVIIQARYQHIQTVDETQLAREIAAEERLDRQFQAAVATLNGPEWPASHGAIRTIAAISKKHKLYRNTAPEILREFLRARSESAFRECESARDQAAQRAIARRHGVQGTLEGLLELHHHEATRLLFDNFSACGLYFDRLALSNLHIESSKLVYSEFSGIAGADLRFNGSDLEGTVFRGPGLMREVHLVECDLERAAFEDLELRDFHIMESNVSSTRFLDLDITNGAWFGFKTRQYAGDCDNDVSVRFERVFFNHVALDFGELQCAYMQKVYFSHCSLSNLNISSSTLQNVSIDNGCNAENLTAMGLKVKGLTVAPGVNLSRSRFGGEFHGCTLAGAILRDCIFSGVILDAVSFSGADLTRSKFALASTLRDASFQGAILRDAEFYDSDLARADFRDADLRGANLEEARNLETANFARARVDVRTKFPPDCLLVSGKVICGERGL